MPSGGEHGLAPQWLEEDQERGERRGLQGGVQAGRGRDPLHLEGPRLQAKAQEKFLLLQGQSWHPRDYNRRLFRIDRMLRRQKRNVHGLICLISVTMAYCKYTFDQTPSNQE